MTGYGQEEGVRREGQKGRVGRGGKDLGEKRKLVERDRVRHKGERQREEIRGEEGRGGREA